VTEPGLDLHEWETQWQELQDLAADAPDETLPEMARLVEEMLLERGYQLDEPVTEEGEDMDVVKNFLAAREIARAVEAREVDPEDVATALEDLSEIHDYLVSDRAPP
jgi:hypothetical protein